MVSGALKGVFTGVLGSLRGVPLGLIKIFRKISGVLGILKGLQGISEAFQGSQGHFRSLRRASGGVIWDESSGTFQGSKGVSRRLQEFSGAFQEAS